MPKLNLRTALRIKAASGEVLALKGAGFDWVRPFEGVPAQPDGYDITFFYGDSLVNKGTPGPGSTDYPRGVNDVDRAGAYQGTGPDAGNFGVAQGIITSDITPIIGNHGDGIDRVKLAEPWVRDYLDVNGAANRRSLVSVHGRSGQASTITPATLAFGNLYYNQAVSAFNAIIAAAKAEFPGSRPKGIVLSPFSNDITNISDLDPAVLQAALEALIDGFRSDLTEGSELAIQFYGPNPNGTGDFNDCRTALAAIVATYDNVEIIDVSSALYAGDGVHPDYDDDIAASLVGTAQLAAMDEPQKVAPFTIAQVNGAAVSTVTESAPVMVRGIGVGVAATLTITGGETAVAPVDDPTNFGAYSSASKAVQWGDMFKARQTSSASEGTTTAVPVTITGPVDFQTANFNVVTAGGQTTNVRPAISEFVLANGVVRPNISSSYKEAS